MPRQTHLRARIATHSPLSAFKAFTTALWSLKTRVKSMFFYLLFPSNALLFAKHSYAVPNSNTEYFSQFLSVCRLDLM